MSAPELERSLQELAADVEWPPTPELRLELEPRRRGLVARRRALVLALALLLLALGVAFAVPSARTAILRFFHLRGATVELVDTLPPAEERALGADLGAAVTAERASRDLGFRILLPPGVEHPEVHELGNAAAILLASPGTVLLTQFRVVGVPPSAMFKKVAGSLSTVEWTEVNREPAIWISGAPHVFFGPSTPPRLAGNTLLWQHGELMMRLEGKGLTKAAALKLASSIR